MSLLFIILHCISFHYYHFQFLLLFMSIQKQVNPNHLNKFIKLYFVFTNTLARSQIRMEILYILYSIILTNLLFHIEFLLRFLYFSKISIQLLHDYLIEIIKWLFICFLFFIMIY